MRINRLLIIGFVLLFFSTCRKKDAAPPPPTPSVPGCATALAPANGAFVTGTSVQLSWSSVSTASSYDVYLGTTPSPTTLVANAVTGTSHTITIPSTPNITYFWYVVPRNTTGPASGCTPTARSFTYIVISNPASLGYHVVGYFPYYRSIADVPDVKFRMTNVVVYAFYQVNAAGSLVPPGSSTASLSAVAAKARSNNAKILLGINDGAGDGKTNFKNMASSPQGRTNFIRDIMNVVRTQQLDGVDMDWEFPTTSDGTDVTFTFELLDNKTDVSAYLWKQSPFSELNMTNTSGKIFTRTITGQTPGATITYACKFAFAGGLAVTKYFSYVVGDACALSTDDNLWKEGFTIYPNPAQDSWTVKTKNIKMSSIQVFDILGKQVLSLTPEATEAKIDASVLKSGLYFAKINTANGSSSLKLVRQ